MAITELKEAIRLLQTVPALWIPGVAGGILAATLWILYNITGTFFTSRLLVIFGLILLLFITGLLTVIKNNGGSVKTLLTGGILYYFRVLLPQLVVIFISSLVAVLVMVTLSLAGLAPDPAILTALLFGIGVPVFVLTFFFDMAAVFEDKTVFESIKRSIEIVLARSNEVISFFLVGFGLLVGIIFALMIVWEALLYEQLQPLTTYNETQLQSFTPDQLTTMLGPSGMWVTAVILFLGVLLLLPLLYSYKACVFRKISGNVISVQQVVGEYDSKGRWYKY
jgi:hypothetical protein